jgi:hypothetical protein
MREVNKEERDKGKKRRERAMAEAQAGVWSRGPGPISDQSL